MWLCLNGLESIPGTVAHFPTKYFYWDKKYFLSHKLKKILSLFPYCQQLEQCLTLRGCSIYLCFKNEQINEETKGNKYKQINLKL